MSASPDSTALLLLSVGALQPQGSRFNCLPKARSPPLYQRHGPPAEMHQPQPGLPHFQRLQRRPLEPAYAVIFDACPTRPLSDDPKVLQLAHTLTQDLRRPPQLPHDLDSVRCLTFISNNTPVPRAGLRIQSARLESQATRRTHRFEFCASAYDVIRLILIPCRTKWLTTTRVGRNPQAPAYPTLLPVLWHLRLSRTLVKMPTTRATRTTVDPP
jgi:hypothetical protein